jgi:hypothetical protein
MQNHNIAKRLEQYTIAHPDEVLIISIAVQNEQDKIIIFKGFSSSLIRSTAFDPEIPVLPDEAIILTIDRLVEPYDPDAPCYIQQGISWEKMQALL